MLFKDDPAITSTGLAPAIPAVVSGPPAQQRVAATYNRIGGLLSRLSAEAKIAVEGALAVWQVESGGRPYQPGKPVLRFEAHKLFANWGKASPANAAKFDAHFQFGGRAGVDGDPWEHHRWREAADGPWQLFHGSQTSEYAVFAFARKLAGDEAACMSASFGGPQILGSNFKAVGYPSAKALFDAMARSEHWEVCSFFDFCLSKGCIDAIRRQDWIAFATTYNGSGQASVYGGNIRDNFDVARALRLPLPAMPKPVPMV